MKLITLQSFSKDRKADADLPVWDVFVRTSHLGLWCLHFSLAYLTKTTSYCCTVGRLHPCLWLFVLHPLGVCRKPTRPIQRLCRASSTVIDFLKDTAKLRPNAISATTPRCRYDLMLLLMLLLTASSGMALMAIEGDKALWPLSVRCALLLGRILGRIFTNCAQTSPYFWSSFMSLGC